MLANLITFKPPSFVFASLAHVRPQRRDVCVCVLLHVSETEVVMSPDLPPQDSALCKTRLARKDGSLIAAALVSLFCCHKGVSEN